WRAAPDFGRTLANVFDDLIKRWYPQDVVGFALDARPAPPYGDDPDKFYSAVVARSCRTCHIAMDHANFELIDPKPLLSNLVCGQAAQTFQIPQTPSSYVMPNAQVTFDRFWLSELADVPGQPSTIIHQPEILRMHAGFMVNDCRNP